MCFGSLPNHSPNLIQKGFLIPRDSLQRRSQVLNRFGNDEKFLLYLVAQGDGEISCAGFGLLANQIAGVGVTPFQNERQDEARAAEHEKSDLERDATAEKSHLYYPF